MKILLIQERGRHEKNRNFRECENLKRAFLNIGIDTTIWGLNYENFSIPFSEIIKDKDIILSIENYDTGWFPDISSYKDKLKIFWSVDSHCALLSHLKTVVNNKFNIVLNSIESHQQFFQNHCKTYYFPNAYPHDLIYPKDNISKIYDIGFCGSLISDRSDWLKYIENYFSLKKDIFVIGDEMVNSINSYKINFNKTLADDINYRVFETMGCKTALISNKPPGIDKLFEDNKHIIYYNNKEELIEKIKYYLSNEEKIKNIAINGYNEVINKHTYFQRAKLLLEILKNEKI